VRALVARARAAAVSAGDPYPDLREDERSCKEAERGGPRT
jgi:hypothetical protein